MTPEKLIEVQKHGREPISLHTPLGEDRDSKFGDLIEDSEAIQPGEAVTFTLLQLQLHSVPGTLSEREAGVVSLRFGRTGSRQPQDVTSHPRPARARTEGPDPDGQHRDRHRAVLRADRRIARQEQ